MAALKLGIASLDWLHVFATLATSEKNQTDKNTQKQHPLPEGATNFLLSTTNDKGNETNRTRANMEVDHRGLPTRQAANFYDSRGTNLTSLGKGKGV